MTLASKITLVRVAMIPAFMVTMYLSGGTPGLWMYVSLDGFFRRLHCPALQSGHGFWKIP